MTGPAAASAGRSRRQDTSGREGPLDSDRLPAYTELPESPTGRGRSAWHLFGTGDNAGLINLQTPQRIASAAAREIRTGRRFALNAPLGRFDPPLYGRKRPRHRLLPDPDDAGFDDELDSFNPQAGSQWDSLGHVAAAPGVFYNGVTAHQVRTQARNTVGEWASRGLAGRAVMVDVERFLGVAAGQAVPISVEQLEYCRRSANAEIEPGDFLLIYTGFDAWYAQQPAATRAAIADERRLTAAGLEHSEAMAEYLWDLHVSAIVSDGPSVEVWPPDWSEPARPFGFLHQTLIGLFGMALGELWWLADLASDCRRDGRYTMFLASAPLNLPGGVSSPANALAFK